jgi:disulfide bond formation protein DsbB
MSFETMKLFFAMGAIVANLLTVALIVIGIAGRNKDESPFEFLRGMTLWLAGGVAIAAMVGSLYLSEVVHLIPCKLCWYQRIAMYPLAILLPVAAWRKDNSFRLYGAVLAVLGLGVATWHRLMQAYPSLDSGACAAVGPPCSAPYITEFGFVTIPYMAISSFVLILALLWANRVNNTRTVATSS